MKLTGRGATAGWPRRRNSSSRLVPEERVELSRGCPRGILSPLRLPFRHSGANAAAQLSASAERVEGALFRSNCIRGETLDSARSTECGLCRLRIMVSRLQGLPVTDLLRPVRLHAGGHSGHLDPKASRADYLARRVGSKNLMTAHTMS